MAQKLYFSQEERVVDKSFIQQNTQTTTTHSKGPLGTCLLPLAFIDFKVSDVIDTCTSLSLG